jgi:hypothetical protein
VITRAANEEVAKVRRNAAEQLRTLLKRYDLAEFQAQTHAIRMVDMLAGFADDTKQSMEFRRQCANDVLDRAYGKPATKARVEITDTAARSASGLTVGEEIEAAIVSAEVFQRLNDLTMRQIPIEQWPEDVREAMGADAAATFASQQQPQTEQGQEAEAP